MPFPLKWNIKRISRCVDNCVMPQKLGGQIWNFILVPQKPWFPLFANLKYNLCDFWLRLLQCSFFLPTYHDWRNRRHSPGRRASVHHAANRSASRRPGESQLAARLLLAPSFAANGLIPSRWTAPLSDSPSARRRLARFFALTRSVRISMRFCFLRQLSAPTA